MHISPNTELAEAVFAKQMKSPGGQEDLLVAKHSTEFVRK